MPDGFIITPLSWTSFTFCSLSRVCCPPGVHLSTNFFVWPAYHGLDTLSHYLAFVRFHHVAKLLSKLPDPTVAHLRGLHCHNRGQRSYKYQAITTLAKFAMHQNPERKQKLSIERVKITDFKQVCFILVIQWNLKSNLKLRILE